MIVTHEQPASRHVMGPKNLFGLLLWRDMEIVPANHRGKSRDNSSASDGGVILRLLRRSLKVWELLPSETDKMEDVRDYYSRYATSLWH
jgi:hypothetical protein